MALTYRFRIGLTAFIKKMWTWISSFAIALATASRLRTRKRAKKRALGGENRDASALILCQPREKSAARAARREEAGVKSENCRRESTAGGRQRLTVRA